MITDIILDLDGTVYPNNNGMWQEIVKRIYDFMKIQLSIPENEIISLRESYFAKYGTTLRGLQHNYDVDSEAYLSYVHDIPLANYVSPDPKLRAMFESLPQKKWILTNADANHADRVLTHLGVRDLFDGLMGVSDNNYATKPDIFPYQQALKMTNHIAPAKCLFADDLEKNLKPAKELGIFTLLIGDKIEGPSIDYACETIHCLPEIINNINEVVDES
jgi:putative hydrolase of the HAD superfamily